MLAADKLQLQSTLKQQATALKEKEFNLHHNNFMTVGTQAAVLAGLDVTMFIEFQPPPNDEWVCVIIYISFVYTVILQMLTSCALFFIGFHCHTSNIKVYILHPNNISILR